MQVRDDCPKGYKRQNLIDIAKNNNIRITRVAPLKGPKNMKELCDDIKHYVSKRSRSKRSRSKRSENNSINKVRDDCPKGYKRDELVDLAKHHSIKITRNPPLKGPKNMKELCEELLKVNKPKKEPKRKSKREAKREAKRELKRKSIRKSKRESKRELKRKSIRKSSFDLDAIGTNPITLDDENVGNYLRENIDNISIKFKNNYYLTDRETIRNVMNSAYFIECRNAVHNINYANVILETRGTRHLFNLMNLGIPLGFVEMNDMLDLLSPQMRKIQTYEVYDTSIKISSTTSKRILDIIEGRVVGEAGFMISGAHCQEGQGGILRRLVPVFDVSFVINVD